MDTKTIIAIVLVAFIVSMYEPFSVAATENRKHRQEP